MAIFDVIKYNGGPDVFAWKYPNEELGTWSQLIVNESQEAVLFKGGKALDIFGSGRHTLETKNIPLLNELVNLPFGGRSPFTAEIWYINKVNSLDIKWGTSAPIQIQDPKYGVFIPIRSNGIFGVQIEDSKKFLVKLVGALPYFDKVTLTKFFRGIYITKVKDAISSYFVKKQISVLEINAYIDEISLFLKERLEPIMEEYGIKLLHFNVNEIGAPEDDSAIIKLKGALAKRAEMNIIGYDYQQERSFDTLEGAAVNPGSMSSGFMGTGIGLGMGVGIGGAMGDSFGSMSRNINVSNQSTKADKICPKCHAPSETSRRFCGSCGYDFDSKPSNEKNILCTNCGHALTTKEKFCPECGNPYNPCPKCGADIKDGETKCHVCGFETAVVSCPSCGENIAPNSKFCPECGSSLVKKCPKCNVTIEGNPKFCPDCGENLK